LRQTIQQTYGPLAARGLALYGLTASEPPMSDPLYGSPAEQWGTDTTFRCGAVAQLVWHASSGNSAYQYEFARVPPGREPVGSTHGSEQTYVFGTLDTGVRGTGSPARITAVDRQLSEAMQRYWTTFAKTGGVVAEGLPPWPRFDARSRAYLQFMEARPVAKEGLRRPFCDLFIDNLKSEF
jgi:para-nitrobenzyl esterase